MDYVTFGQVITDDVYFPDKENVINQLGGAVYTASGMRYWSDSVGICSGVGVDFLPMHGDWFHLNGIDTRGCTLKARRSCHSAIHYFDDGERTEISLPGCPSIRQMCPQISDMPPDYLSCKGFYFFKDCEPVFWEMTIDYLKKWKPVSVWEILGVTACPENYDRIKELLPEVTIFSLNLTEGRRLCQKSNPVQIVRELLSMGANVVLLRMSENGALAGDSSGIWHIPAYQSSVVDVTGGGNSSTGGFLAGYCENNGNIAAAGRCASASASFIIEQYGQPKQIGEIQRKEAKIRADSLCAEKIEG